MNTVYILTLPSPFTPTKHSHSRSRSHFTYSNVCSISQSLPFPRPSSILSPLSFRFSFKSRRSPFSSDPQLSDIDDDNYEVADEYDEYEDVSGEDSDDVQQSEDEDEISVDLSIRKKESTWQRVERLCNLAKELGEEMIDVFALADIYDFRIDKFQRMSIEAFLRGSSVVVSASTSSGKTLIAEAAAVATVAGRRRETFRDNNVGLLTGDSAVNKDAKILVLTTEILRNMLYNSVGMASSGSGLFHVDVIVLDEVHYLSDISRGTVWEEIVIYCPEEVQLICLSATVANPDEIAGWIGQVVFFCLIISYVPALIQFSCLRVVMVCTISFCLHLSLPLFVCPALSGSQTQNGCAHEVFSHDLGVGDTHWQCKVKGGIVPNGQGFAWFIFLAKLIHGKTELVTSSWRPVPLTWHFSTKTSLFRLLNEKGTHMNRRYSYRDDGSRRRNYRDDGSRRRNYRDDGSGRRNSRRYGRNGAVDSIFGMSEQPLTKNDKNMIRRSQVPQIVDTLWHLKAKDMLPAIWFIFNRRGCDAAVQYVEDCSLLDECEMSEVELALKKFWLQYPDAVRETARGLVKVVFATETLAAGINMPARTAVISSLSKRTSTGRIQLSPNELLQMAGRAGRRGIDERGHVVIVQTPYEGAEECCKLLFSGVEPLVSQFTASYGMVLNLLGGAKVTRRSNELDETNTLQARRTLEVS
ncbi:hypothetical protein V6N13_134040 [Hibiscus sabdariffa]